MVRIDKKTGNLIIEIKKEDFFNPVEELQIRREALYSAFIEHNGKDFINSSDLFYGIVSMLKDTEPTADQWEQILKTDSEK